MHRVIVPTVQLDACLLGDVLLVVRARGGQRHGLAVNAVCAPQAVSIVRLTEGMLNGRGTTGAAGARGGGGGAGCGRAGAHCGGGAAAEQ